MARMARFLVVQPHGRDKGREATVIYEAVTADAGFAEIDRLAEQMKMTGARPDSMELLVVDENRQSLPSGRTTI